MNDLKNFYIELKSGKANLKNIPKRASKFLYFKLKQKFYPCVITIYGTKIYFHKNDQVISRYLVYDRCYEFEISEYVRKKITKKMNVVDIGANIGYYSVLFSKWTENQSKIYVFEPEPENFNLLLKNILVNNCKNVIPINKAVSDKDGKAILSLSDDNKGDNTIIDFKIKDNQSRINKVEIQCTKLDSVISSSETINLIKMDVQGAEMLALKGMTQTIKNNKNLILITEFWPYAIKKSGYSPKYFIEHLMNWDFKLSTFLNGKLVPFTLNNDLIYSDSQSKQTNLICEKY